jgi:endogenous inhibitor of DNA gyrase (YacG/DUF329 family)
MKVWNAVVTLGVGLLFVFLLYPVSNFAVTGWVFLFQIWGLLWIQSLWPLHSWVEPLGMLPAYVSVAAFWVALVLQTRRFLGLAEGTEIPTERRHWSVRLSCTVFGFTSFVAWRAHTFMFNLVLAATSVDSFSTPLLLALFAGQQLVITAVVGLAIAVPNYGHLPVTWIRRLTGTVSSWWTELHDHRLLGKRSEAHGVGAKPRRRETGRSFRAPSSISPVYSTQGDPGYTIHSPTSLLFPLWMPSGGQFPGSVPQTSEPMVTVDQGECSICGKNLAAEAQVLRCPYCSARAHQRHFLKWLRENVHCPRCRKPLTPYDLVEG